MDAEEPTRADYIKAGVFFLLIFVGVGYIFPRFMGALLMLFSALVFVLAVVGLAWPSVMKLPNRLASVWVFAVAVGLFMGGGMLRAPQNGISTASDVPPTERVLPAPETPAEREARIAQRIEETRRDRTTQQVARRRAVDQSAPRDPCSYSAEEFARLSPAESERVWNACVEQMGGSAAVDAAAGITPESEDELVRLALDVEGMTACQDVLQEAARGLYRQGGLYRWTQTALTTRLSRESLNGDVTTYSGNTLQVMNQEGEWVWANYECDYDNEAGVVVDVRVR